MKPRPNEVQLTAAHREYLAAFDDWLKNVWAPGLTGPDADAATERKSAALERILEEPKRARKAA